MHLHFQIPQERHRIESLKFTSIPNLKKKKSYLWHSKVALLRFALSFHFILPVEKIPKHKNLSFKEQKFVCIGHCSILST